MSIFIYFAIQWGEYNSQSLFRPKRLKLGQNLHHYF
eukprot:UN06668